MKKVYELNPNNSMDQKFVESVDKFYNEHYNKKDIEKEAKLASGEWIEVDGKIYDSKYYKG